MQIYDDPTWVRAAFIWVTQAITMANHNTVANDTTNENTKQMIRHQRKAR